MHITTLNVILFLIFPYFHVLVNVFGWWMDDERLEAIIVDGVIEHVYEEKEGDRN